MKNEKKICYMVLARDRYAKCPEGVSKRRFAGIRNYIELRYRKEWLNTPEGLYTDSEIWNQTLNYILKWK